MVGFYAKNGVPIVIALKPMNATIAIADHVTTVVKVCIFISPISLGEPPAGG
jgi:hypothetical protein